MVPCEVSMPRLPGPQSQLMLDELRRYVIAQPQPFAVSLSNSKGMFLATVDGQLILDWAGYYGSRLLGHNHPGMFESEYLQRLILAANNKVPNPDYLTEECLAYYRLAWDLAAACIRNGPLEIYVVNSGAEAVENLMKYLIARHGEKLRSAQKTVKTRRFVYFDRGFHGRTLGALNVTHLTHNSRVTDGFSDLFPGNLRLSFPHLDHSRTSSENEQELGRCLDEVETALQTYRDEVVGVLVEPIQGAGGHRLAPMRFFQGLSQLCHDYDTYLAFDEVQTAGGQCGRVFAVDLMELPYPPECIAAAKKLGNGVIYMRQPLQELGVLDSTWGGSLADMVRVVQEFKIVDELKLQSQVDQKATALVSVLTELEARHAATIYNVRGLGLYQGFSLRHPEDRDRLMDFALKFEDLLLLGAGLQTIRLRPPIDVTLADIQEFGFRLDRSLTRLSEFPR